MADPPAASTSRPASATCPTFTPPPRLVGNLAALRDPSQVSDDLWTETTEASVLWLLSLKPPAASALHQPSFKGKERARVDENGVAVDEDLVHWFCGAKGAQECWEPAIFCIRLLGMKRVGEVAEWRDSFERLMGSCPACVRAYQTAKANFRDEWIVSTDSSKGLALILASVHSYLRHYKPDKSIQTFTNGVEAMEIASVMRAFAAAGFDTPPNNAAGEVSTWRPSRRARLNDVAEAAVENVFSNPRLFEKDEVVEMLLSGVDSHDFRPLALPPMPSAGLLAFRLHFDHGLRAIADLQLRQCKAQPDADAFRKQGLASVIDSHLGVLASRDRDELNAPTGIRMHYTDERNDFMGGLASCLWSLSAEAIKQVLVRKPTSLSASLDVVHLVAAHLADRGDHLVSVVDCFTVLLERLGTDFWSVGDEKYEEVVLHAILDNDDFHEAFAEQAHQQAATSEAQTYDTSWLAWLPPFLASVAQSPAFFTNALAIITSTFLDRLQQSRFDPLVRTAALRLAVGILSDVFISNTASAPSNSSSEVVAVAPRYPHAAAAAKILDLHAATLASFAFSASYATTTEWGSAVELARSFVGGVLKRDGRTIARAVYNLATFSQNHHEHERRERKRLQLLASGDSRAKKDPQPAPVPTPNVAFAKALWDQAYRTVREGDAAGIALLVQGAAPTAQFEKLTSRSWAIKDLVRPQMKAINDALATARDPIVDVIMQLADERTDVLLDFFGRPGVVQAVIAFLISPVETVHNAVQGLVKQVFDVTTRRDVFRCLISRWPEQSLRGLAHTLQLFQTSSRLLPEACGLAKRLVRCFSDVLDVLCDTTDGLLRDPDFVRRGRDVKLQAKLLALWKLMAEALGLLFKRTPEWANYFENDEMTEWMRDAVLFGADMLEQIRILETIIAGQALDRFATGGSAVFDSPAKKSVPATESTTAEQMIGVLAEPLEESIAWLRLNDVDLLNQTFALVLKMVGRFTRSRIPLRETTHAKLKRLADRPAANADQRRSTILRESQLLEIREALEDNDDAVRRRKEGAAVEVLDLSDETPKLTSRASSVASSSSGTLRVKGQLKTTLAPPQQQAAKSGRTASPLASSKARPPPAIPARPRGVPWTTYSSKKAESASESSDDEDAVRGADGKKLTGLALLAKDQKPSIKKTTSGQRKIQLIGSDGKSTGPTSSRTRTLISVGRSKEDMQAIRAARLRSAQDLSRLHRAVLQWDPSANEDAPPDVDLLKRLPESFKTPKEYFAAFEPLLLTECWEQIRQAKLEALKESDVILADIAGRQSVDDFVDIFCTIQHGQLRSGTYFGDTDLVWLRQGPRQIFAKIQVVSRKREHIELTLRCHLGKDVHSAGSGLTARTKWEMVKLVNLSTVHREYAALQALEFIDLCGDVLAPRPPPSIKTDPRTIEKTMSAYKVNEPQAIAIHGALRTQGFNLIQGPPGTGKTSTIVGLVGAFVDSRPRVAAPIDVGRPTDTSQIPPVAKVLLCAPSNAAVDEVAKRLKEGVRLMDGSLYVPKVVRIGADSAIDIAVKDVFIDELVERATSGNKSTTGTNDAQSRMQNMRNEIDSLRSDRDAKKVEMDSITNNEFRRGELNLELRKIKARIFELSQMLDSEKDKAQQSRRTMDAEQRKMRLKILSEADVICSTLSGAGHDYMSQLPFDFETVIIDEAAQSIELSSLIPLKYGCTRCILVGDPLQLPPTVISGVAARGGYDRSLFVRVMQRGPQAVHLLSIQYRMHPNISAFPSAAFYQSRLTDGPEMDKKTLQPWHANALFPPYTFYHIEGQEMSGRHHSYTNPVEAATALAIYERLRRDYPSTDFDYRIGIVTPYKGQVIELKRTFRQKYGEEIVSKIAFNTVDGFQGQEKDIIILSCVRGGSADKGVGFLADTRRMNVALTRARSSIWILGDSNKLRANQYWGQLVSDAESRALFRKADVQLFRSSYSAPPVVGTAVPSVPVSRSRAKQIEMSPAYSSTNGLVAATPPHVVNGTGSALKKRLTDAMDVDSPAKRPKMEVGEGEEKKPRVQVLRPPVQRAQPPPEQQQQTGPAKRKAPPSLFVPKKRPPPK
ncbi:tRNA-splicing endonuclease [Rhodotorula toruloides]|uniref:tRNA-splicing endonuclease n=1 Tax=Rhodotorula toruloides TaxID=5286 RepID=A0A511KL05_RHOTO|nr:tRNA-splicing endonuclease [Rhodotorula toruloides]